MTGQNGVDMSSQRAPPEKIAAECFSVSSTSCDDAGRQLAESTETFVLFSLTFGFEAVGHET